MGVEPTDACCSQPPTDFEDQGRHRTTSTPIGNIVNYFYVFAITPGLRRFGQEAQLTTYMNTSKIQTPIVIDRTYRQLKGSY